MSCEANGLKVDLKAVLDPDHRGEVGVPAGAELLAFANAVEGRHGNIGQARDALTAVIGADATLEAAAIIAVFNGLVRVADGTGIQLDEGVFTASVVEREMLDINRFAGAANSVGVATAAVAPTAVDRLFGSQPVR